MTKQIVMIALISLGVAGCSSSSPPANNAGTQGTGPANQSAASNNSTSAISATPIDSPDSKSGSPTPHASPAQAETTDKEGNKKINVHFAPGKSEGTYSNTFAGYGYVDYEFRASKGQTLTTKIVKSDGDDAILGVMRNDLMVAPGSTQIPDWSGELPEDGTYTIRVGQMRAQARRSDKPKHFTLLIRID